MRVASSFPSDDQIQSINAHISEPLRNGIEALTRIIYPDADLYALTGKICAAFWPDDLLPMETGRLADETLWSEKDNYVITYGNTFIDGEHKPLDLLHDFLTRYLDGVVSGVHILPYFPFTSDDGFAVTDYREVNSQLGAWEDIGRISQNFTLMSDLVINHCSSQSKYFNEYLQGHEPYDGFFFEADPADDISQVVRPRAHPLLRRVETANGPKHVWCTFSHDQIDFDFSNPRVLLEFLSILRFHMDHGVDTLRLDAVAFLWKEVGTRSIHMPQTHAVVQLMRLLADHNEQPLMIITETNVPNAENLSYFGQSNEAQAVYNFSLPPLILHALHNGSSHHLNEWQASKPPLRPGCTYFNFTASHDGIGMRPAEGYLSDGQIDEMIETVRSFGGRVSMREVSRGVERPYEINSSLFDALKGTVKGADEWNVERFLCSQTVALALQGIPGIYIHSLLATHNDYAGMEREGYNRAINRRRWNYPEIRTFLESTNTVHAQVFSAMKELIAIRSQQSAFHPNSAQKLLALGEELFGFVRTAHDGSQTVYCIHNLTDRQVSIPASVTDQLTGENWIDLVASKPIEMDGKQVELSPYQCVWISNSP